MICLKIVHFEKSGRPLVALEASKKVGGAKNRTFSNILKLTMAAQTLKMIDFQPGMIGRFGPDYKEDCRHRFRSKASPGSRRCATILTSFGLCIHVYELDQCM